MPLLRYGAVAEYFVSAESLARATVHLRTFTALGVAGLFAICATPSFGKDAEPPPSARIVVPDFYPNPRVKLCSLAVELHEVNQHVRERLLDQFVSASYDQTKRWKHGFIVYGIDYDSYSRFFVVDRAPCSAVQRQTTTLLDRTFGRRRWTTKEEWGSGRLGDYALVKSSGPAAIFYYYQPKADIQSCLVTLTDRPDVSWESYPRIADTLNDNLRRYRLPMLGAYFRNKMVYILFTSECDRRQEFMGKLFRLIAKTNKTFPQLFLAPDYRSGAEGFLDSYPVSVEAWLRKHSHTPGNTKSH